MLIKDSDYSGAAGGQMDDTLRDIATERPAIRHPDEVKGRPPPPAIRRGLPGSGRDVSRARRQHEGENRKPADAQRDVRYRSCRGCRRYRVGRFAAPSNPARPVARTPSQGRPARFLRADRRAYRAYCRDHACASEPQRRAGRASRHPRRLDESREFQANHLDSQRPGLLGNKARISRKSKSS